MPALFGLDMLTLFGLAIVGCGALGWLMGPAVGGILFKATNRRAVPAMVEVRYGPMLMLFSKNEEICFLSQIQFKGAFGSHG